MTQDVHRSQKGPPILRLHQGSGRDAEPHRGSEGVLRPVPAGSGAGRRAARRGPAGGVQVRVPDLRLFEHGAAGVRALRFRAAEIRCGRVPPARHDLLGAAQGDAAPDRVRRRPGYAGQVGQGHQGAGSLHGRDAAHDDPTAPSSSTAPSASSSRRCTVRRASSSTTTRARPIRRASCSSPPASSPIAVPGSTSSSTPRTSSMRASTGAGRFR